MGFEDRLLMYQVVQTCFIHRNC